MVEAVRMLERGDATAEDIDAAMRLGAGMSNSLSITSLKGVAGGEIVSMTTLRTRTP